jgi:hypothetical protein
MADRLTQTVDVISRARRIRYTRNFFPESTAQLRARLFADLGNGEIALSRDVSPDLHDGDEETQQEPSSWMLYEYAPFSNKIEDYQERRQEALEESLTRLQDGEWLYSSRLANMWAAQRRLQRESWLTASQKERNT